MAGRLETYDDEDAARSARDHYNHNLGKRAVLFKLPNVGCTDYGGGVYDDIFKEDIGDDLWVVAVED